MRSRCFAPPSIHLNNLLRPLALKPSEIRNHNPMKNVILILTLIISTISFAQNIDTTVSRWQFGVNFSGDYAYRQLHDNDPDTDFSSLIEGRNDSEQAKIGYTTGLNVNYRLNIHAAIGLGIQYSNKGFRAKERDVIFTNANAEEIPAKYSASYNFHYLDLPLTFNYTTGTGKVKFIGSAGIVTSVYLAEKDRTDLYHDGVREYSKQSSLHEAGPVFFSPVISAGISYALNDGMMLRLEPTFRYGITKINDTPLTTSLYSAGLNIGYFVRF